MVSHVRMVAVLLTCHNRRETTLQSLERLYAQAVPEGYAFKVFLVDDGCTDGTGEAVKATHPDIQVIKGDGTLFWCNGMRLAWEHAAKEDPDFYLWLNDDSMLLDGAIEKLLDCWSQVVGGKSDSARDQELLDGRSTTQQPNNPATSSGVAVIVGSCCDPETGELTYGGQRRLGKHPAKLKTVVPTDRPEPCDTFQGNVVLVPREVYKRVGNMCSFSHAMGDTDYGYRATQAGCKIWVALGYVAKCDKNMQEMLSKQQNHSLIHRLKVLKKRLPPGDWFRFLWFHAGWKVILYWPKPYIRIALNLGSRFSRLSSGNLL